MMIYKYILVLFINFICFGKNLTLESRINPPNRELMDIEIINDIMIIPGNLDGYDFYDISDPKNPFVISNLEIPIGNGNRSLPGLWVTVTEDSIAYITCRTKQEGSAIIDFSDPYNPEYMGSLSYSDLNIDNPSFEGSAVNGDLLAVAAHEDGLLFYDISNPIEPIFISQRMVENAWTVVFIDSNNYAIADNEYGLIIDQWDCPTDTCESSYIFTEGVVKDLLVVDSLLFIAEGSDGLSVYNISNINQPIFLDQYDTDGLTNKIAFFNNKIAVSDWLDVKIFEWNGSSLELIGYKNTGKRTMAIATRDSIIFSAEWQHLQTFSFGEIQQADLDISSWDISFPLLEIEESDTIDLVFENNGNSVLNISNFYINHSDFEIINLPDIIYPEEIIPAKLIYTKSDLNASGILQLSSNDPDESEIEISLVGNYEGGIVGASAPDFTLPIAGNGDGYFNLNEQLGKIVVIAFFAPGWPVCIPELSDLETSIWQSFPQDSVTLVGITSVNQSQIDQFLEDTGITYPILQDESSNGSGPGGFGGVVYDDYYIPNQGSPYPRDFIVDQNGILVYANNEMDTDYMIYIIEELLIDDDEYVEIDNSVKISNRFYIYSNYPNPFNPSTTLRYYLFKDQFINVTIYDISGKVVRNLINKNQKTGYNFIKWDSKNNEGKLVSGGIYMYNIQSEYFRETRKMILLK